MLFGMPWHLGAFCVRSYKILFSYAYFGCWPFLTYPCASSKRYSGCSSWKSSKFLTFKGLWYLKLIYGIGFWMLEINILKIYDQILVLLLWCLVKILVLERVLNALQIFLDNDKIFGYPRIIWIRIWWTIQQIWEFCGEIEKIFGNIHLDIRIIKACGNIWIF